MHQDLVRAVATRVTRRRAMPMPRVAAHALLTPVVPQPAVETRVVRLSVPLMRV
jgi:hypothetical protein